MTRPFMGKSVSGTVKSGAAELALVRPFVAVDVHVFAKVRLRVKTLWRDTKLTLK
jgi:hypothetical protein